MNGSKTLVNCFLSNGKFTWKGNIVFRVCTEVGEIVHWSWPVSSTCNVISSWGTDYPKYWISKLPSQGGPWDQVSPALLPCPSFSYINCLVYHSTSSFWRSAYQSHSCWIVEWMVGRCSNILIWILLKLNNHQVFLAFTSSFLSPLLIEAECSQISGPQMELLCNLAH